MGSGKLALPQSWNRYTYCLNNPLVLVDPSGLIWGSQDYYEGGEHLRRYRWFAGNKVGKGFTAFTPSKNGTVIALADGGGARLYRNGSREIYAGPAKITITGQERLNASAGMFDGSVPFGREIRHMSGMTGGVDESSSEYQKASTLSNGTQQGALLLTGVGEAELSEEAIGLKKMLASEGQAADVLGSVYISG